MNHLVGISDLVGENAHGTTIGHCQPIFDIDAPTSPLLLKQAAPTDGLLLAYPRFAGSDYHYFLWKSRKFRVRSTFHLRHSSGAVFYPDFEAVLRFSDNSAFATATEDELFYWPGARLFFSDRLYGGNAVSIQLDIGINSGGGSNNYGLTPGGIWPPISTNYVINTRPDIFLGTTQVSTPAACFLPAQVVHPFVNLQITTDLSFLVPGDIPSNGEAFFHTVAWPTVTDQTSVLLSNAMVVGGLGAMPIYQTSYVDGFNPSFEYQWTFSEPLRIEYDEVFN